MRRLIDADNLEEQITRLQDDLNCYQNPSEVVDVLDYVLQLIDEAPTIEPYGKWIPCSERLPEEKINPITQDYYEYPVTAVFGDVEDIRYYKFGKGHWWHGAGVVDHLVIAWMLLPEPYREVKDDRD